MQNSVDRREADIVAGRYRLESHIATGGMSEVWCATDLTASATVALKFLAPALSTQAGYAALLQAEASKLSRLSHPHIVRMHAFGEHQGHGFMVLDYLAGGSLLDQRGANWRKVVRLALPVAQALRYVHDQGIVHRDLKPGNILFDAQGMPCLSDFGIAGEIGLAVDQQPRGGGSLPAMSPQQLSGEAATIGDDVYGFGALLYDLLTGASLFAANCTPERVRFERPQSVAASALGGPVPDILAELVYTALEKNPGSRPAHMGAVVENLRRLESLAG